MTINFINLKAQYSQYKQEIDASIADVLQSTQFIGGNTLMKFEKNLAHYTGSDHAIGCSSGTDALLLAMMALGIKPGDEVITTPFTFIATAETIAFLGAKPVFVDIDEKSYNLDANMLEQAITAQTKAIIPVSLFGQCADMDHIVEIADAHDIAVIEDGCQSFGATYKGRASCNLSLIGCTSFFPSKPLGCYGDGGALFTNDDALNDRIRMILNHGQKERYKHELIGINGRLDTLQAAILDVKLRYFDQEVQERQKIGERYSDLLADSAVITPYIDSENSSVYAQYSLRSNQREKIIAHLNENNIPTAIHYPIALHLQEAFAYLGYSEGDFPISEKIASEIFSIPMSAFLQEDEQDYIISKLLEIE